MPLRKEFRKFYGREWREVIRPRILERARHRCELCRAPNHRTLVRSIGGSWRLPGDPFWRLPGGYIWHKEFDAPWRTVDIVLTIAHLNHTPGDERDENLKALCQYCHLKTDFWSHRLTRQTRKDLSRPLLSGTINDAC